MKKPRNPDRFFLVATMLVLTLCYPAYTASSQSLLWKITAADGSSPSYLYGTIHLTDSRVFAWKDSVYNRLAQCSMYAGELDLSMENMLKAAGMMMHQVFC